MAVQVWPHPDAGELSAGIEQALASGHELRELALLASLRAGRTRLSAERTDEARRLIGGYGDDIGTRLGAPEYLDPTRAWTLTEESLHRWRGDAENGTLTEDQRRAARTVVRSCEGLLTELAHTDRR